MIQQAPALDRHWHLGRNDEELTSAVSELTPILLLLLTWQR